MKSKILIVSVALMIFLTSCMANTLDNGTNNSTTENITTLTTEKNQPVQEPTENSANSQTNIENSTSLALESDKDTGIGWTLWPQIPIEVTMNSIRYVSIRDTLMYNGRIYMSYITDISNPLKLATYTEEDGIQDIDIELTKNMMQFTVWNDEIIILEFDRLLFYNLQAQLVREIDLDGRTANYLTQPCMSHDGSTIYFIGGDDYFPRLFNVMTNEIETISDISIPGTQGDMMYSYIGQIKRDDIITLIAWQPEEEETSHYLFYDVSSKTIVDYICTPSSMDRIFIDDTHIRFLPINQEDNVRNSIGELTYRSPIDEIEIEIADIVNEIIYQISSEIPFYPQEMVCDEEYIYIYTSQDGKAHMVSFERQSAEP